MQIQVNTDKNIEGTEALKQQVASTLERILDRFSNHITRVEVHLSDENSASKDTSMDKRCLLEVRVAGMQPVSVTDQADTVDQVVTGAARKMVSALDSALGKMSKS
ncbi:HPF/RaiA family ribosome-associated protein [Nitrincola alkalilacustris]|uniref:HPF/RaiA family ribosome-associated protein n=1 Tax=Nitrincola alkalilacustris TaxID=1571224 RepID=UPI00124C23A5|nr:HPF/RaiA family ribosome-associated protein [Nitrincola alkalilacustris]